MRNDFVGGVTFVDGRLEDLHALARDLRAAQAADQLFALAGKHRADYDFDPAHIAFDDVHICSLESSFSSWSSVPSVRVPSPVCDTYRSQHARVVPRPYGLAAAERAAARRYIFSL